MLSSRNQRMAIAAFAVALGFPALADTPTIDTYSSWDKSRVVSTFGCPNSTTYGQVITVPSGMHHLDKFTFWMQNISGSSGTMVVRAYVYRWDAANFTLQYAAKYESPPRTISFADTLFHPETFTPGIVVTPGVQYVMFASIDREYVDCTANYLLGWGFLDTSVYSGGSFVYENEAGDDLQWPTKGWGGFSDLAFKAYLSP